MRAWARPTVPVLGSLGEIPRIYDSATDSIVEARPADATSGRASLYVCGITPYDATHLGHAATYLAYDTLVRLWLDAGFEVEYAQNTTDVDDPLLERAARDGFDWRDLAAQQTDLFRSDMEHLRIIPPDHYIAVTEVVAEIAEAVIRLVETGSGYAVTSVDAAPDIYFDSSLPQPPWVLGQESRLDQQSMLDLSAERGGDPGRSGKRHPLDPLLWRAAREGEPSWPSALGAGRPGWHIECSVIAERSLTTPITVNGGGSDLLFPHHEFSAGHTAALTGHALAGIYSHSGMVAYQGSKMSKSLGNLVLVSRLVAGGADPRGIRLALLAEHYRSDWEWTDEHLETATRRLEAWSAWATEAADAPDAVPDSNSRESDELIANVRAVLTDDLRTPAALALIDAAAELGITPTAEVATAIDALLGIDLR